MSLFSPTPSGSCSKGKRPPAFVALVEADSERHLVDHGVSVAPGSQHFFSLLSLRDPLRTSSLLRIDVGKRRRTIFSIYTLNHPIFSLILRLYANLFANIEEKCDDEPVPNSLLEARSRTLGTTASLEDNGDTLYNTSNSLHPTTRFYIRSSYPKLYSILNIKLFLGNTLNGLVSRSPKFVRVPAARLSSRLLNSLLSFLV